MFMCSKKIHWKWCYADKKVTDAALPFLGWAKVDEASEQFYQVITKTLYLNKVGQYFNSSLKIFEKWAIFSVEDTMLHSRSC